MARIRERLGHQVRASGSVVDLIGLASWPHVGSKKLTAQEIHVSNRIR